VSGRRLVFAAVAVCVALTALYAFVRRPQNAFLVARDGAEWIRAARPFDLVARSPSLESVPFRHRFTNALPAGAPAALEVQGLRAFRLSLNGRVLGEVGPQAASWRYPQRFDLSPALVPGTNELRIDVQNDTGWPLVLASSRELALATGPDWEAPGPGGAWRPALSADDGRHHAISDDFPGAWQGLRASWATFAVAFALGALASLVAARVPGSRASQVRWLVMGALAAIGLHNLRLVDITLGFDAEFHFDYIRKVAFEHRLPLANEGWQAFQAPLFYLAAAPVYAAVSRIGSEALAMLAMRGLVLIASLGLVEMVYRGARAAFPEREDLQMLATAVGGFLPVTVYMSHYVSNEPLAALLTAALVVASLRTLTDPGSQLERGGLVLGALFGLAVLAKVTAVLMLPLVVAVLARAARRRGLPLGALVGPLARFAAVGGAIAGWYFVRNQVVLGAPYVGGWDPSRGAAWIQDPGYRTPSDLLTFGAALDRPIYDVFTGLWDALYATFWLDGFLGSSAFAPAAPPWHYGYAVACALLALPLTAMMLAGFVRSLRRPRTREQEALLFASAAVALYVGAILALYLRLPVFSTVKSSYTLGLAPCYGLLFAWGADLLPRRPAVRALLVGYLAAWLAFVFRAYFS
jgi:hypothetical protein